MNTIENIRFIYISKDDTTRVRDFLCERYKKGKTVPGTRSFHHFIPTTTTPISYKCTSEDNKCVGTFNIVKGTLEKDSTNDIEHPVVKLMDFVACKYDSFWWVGLIGEVVEVNKDVKVVFLHPHGPGKSFTWPNREDCCWVPLTNILQVIKTSTTRTGHIYDISNADYDNIIKNVSLI